MPEPKIDLRFLGPAGGLQEADPRPAGALAPVWDPATEKWVMTPDIGGSVGAGEISNTELATMAQATLKGRHSGGGTGAPEDLSPADVRTILNVADGAAALPATMSDGDIDAGSSTTVGSVTPAKLKRAAQTWGAGTPGDGTLTNAKLANVATQTFKGRNTGGTGAPEDLSVATVKTMLGIDGSGFVDDSVSNSTLANVPTATIKGRVTAGTGDPEDLTTSQVKTLLALTADDVANTGSKKWVVADGVANADMANMAQSTIKGRAASAGTGDPTDLTAAQVKTLLAYTTADIPDATDARYMSDAQETALDTAISTGVADRVRLITFTAAAQTTALAATAGRQRGNFGNGTAIPRDLTNIAKVIFEGWVSTVGPTDFWASIIFSIDGGTTWLFSDGNTANAVPTSAVCAVKYDSTLATAYFSVTKTLHASLRVPGVLIKLQTDGGDGTTVPVIRNWYVDGSGLQQAGGGSGAFSGITGQPTDNAALASALNARKPLVYPYGANAAAAKVLHASDPQFAGGLDPTDATGAGNKAVTDALFTALMAGSGSSRTVVFPGGEYNHRGTLSPSGTANGAGGNPGAKLNLVFEGTHFKFTGAAATYYMPIQRKVGSSFVNMSGVSLVGGEHPFPLDGSYPVASGTTFANKFVAFNVRNLYEANIGGRLCITRTGTPDDLAAFASSGGDNSITGHWGFKRGTINEIRIDGFEVGIYALSGGVAAHPDFMTSAGIRNFYFSGNRVWLADNNQLDALDIGKFLIQGSHTAYMLSCRVVRLGTGFMISTTPEPADERLLEVFRSEIRFDSFYARSNTDIPAAAYPTCALSVARRSTVKIGILHADQTDGWARGVVWNGNSKNGYAPTETQIVVDMLSNTSEGAVGGGSAGIAIAMQADTTMANQRRKLRIGAGIGDGTFQVVGPWKASGASWAASTTDRIRTFDNNGDLFRKIANGALAAW